jgi:PBSX family phage terminase large subunit
MLTVEMIAPHEKQFDFITSTAKFRAFVGGVGSGKTLIGCTESLKFCVKNPGCLFVIASPTYPMLRDATQRTFFDICPPHLIKSFNKSHNEVMLINGSEILFRSCEDPERLRGPNLAGFYGDEAALWPHMAWKILIGRLRQPGFEHKAWITSTPKGFTWIYDEFVKKQRGDYELVYCSSKDNPYLPEDFIRALEESYSGNFARQEIYGEFVAHEGVVYNQFQRLVHVQKCQQKEIKSVIYGVDWGYTNPSVILAIGLDSDNRAYVMEEFYQKRIAIEDLVGIAKQMQARYGEGAFYADPSEPQFIAAFNNAGLSCIAANNEIMPGINNVGKLLEVKDDKRASLYIDPSCVNTIMELENYSYPESRENRPELDKPLKVHDHAMDALRYALISLRQGEFVVLDKLGALFDSE